MARINQEILDELVEDCSAGNDEYVVSKWIIEKVPAIFNGNFEQFVKVKLSIAKQLVELNGGTINAKYIKSHLIIEINL